MRRLFKHLSSALAASVINKMITGAVGVLLIPIYLKHLTAEEYGVWLMILGVTAYLSLANFGLAQTLGNSVAAKWNQPKEHEQLTDLVSSGWMLYNVIAFGVSCVVCLVAVGYALSVTTQHTIFWPLLISAVGFMLALPWQIFSVTLRSTGRILEEQGLAAGSSVLRYLMTAAALACGQELMALAIINTLTIALPRVAARLYLRRRLPWFKVSSPRASWELNKQMLRPSAAFFLIQVAGLLAFSTDTIVIGLFLGASTVPAYAVPMQFIALALSLVTLISGVGFPQITNLYANAGRSELRVFVLSLAARQYISGAVTIVLCAMFGQQFIEYWAGPAMVPRGSVFYGFAAFASIQVIMAPLDAVVMATSSHRTFSYFALAEGLLNLSLSLAVVGEYGVAGVIFATVMARLVTFTALLAETCKVIDYPVQRYLGLMAIFFGLPCVTLIWIGWSGTPILPSGLSDTTFIAQLLTLFGTVTILGIVQARLFTSSELP